jgi:hypothetical protein
LLLVSWSSADLGCRSSRIQIIKLCLTSGDTCHDWPSYKTFHTTINTNVATSNATWKLVSTLKSSVFCNVMPCSLLKVNWCYRGGWKQHLRLKHHLTFNGLHGIISQKIEVFITTTVRTSNLALTLSLFFMSICWWNSFCSLSLWLCDRHNEMTIVVAT